MAAVEPLPRRPFSLRDLGHLHGRRMLLRSLAGRWAYEVRSWPVADTDGASWSRRHDDTSASGVDLWPDLRTPARRTETNPRSAHASIATVCRPIGTRISIGVARDHQ